jgi:hypothetical protein
MDVTDTKPLEKCCSRCKNIKNEDKFIPKRNICKECRNNRSREKYNSNEVNNEIEQDCVICNKSKLLSLFIKNRNICKECNNNNRKEKYKTDEEHRIKIIEQVTTFKHNKIIEKQKLNNIIKIY